MIPPGYEQYEEAPPASVRVELSGAALQDFLVDVGITFAESGLYSWWKLREYAWWCPDLAGGSAPPLRMGDRLVGNLQGRLQAMNPDEGAERRWLKARRLCPGLVLRGFERISAGEVEGLSEAGRGRILAALAALDAGAVDASDADVVLQVAVLGEVVYS